jgi:hypothetical protein
MNKKIDAHISINSLFRIFSFFLNSQTDLFEKNNRILSILYSIIIIKF